MTVFLPYNLDVFASYWNDLRKVLKNIFRAQHVRVLYLYGLSTFSAFFDRSNTDEFVYYRNGLTKEKKNKFCIQHDGGSVIVWKKEGITFNG